MNNNIDFRKALGAVLREKREEKELSQIYIAELFGISKNHVSNWELGKRKIYAEQLVDYCRILGIKVQDALDLADEYMKYMED